MFCWRKKMVWVSEWIGELRKCGSWNKKREGLSLLSLLSRCSSVVGTRHLRSLLRCPSTSLALLKSRHRAIAFFSAAQNVEVVKALIAGLKQVKNFHRIMKKLSGSKASIADWRSLQRTLAGIWQLMEVRFNFSFTINILRSSLILRWHHIAGAR